MPPLNAFIDAEVSVTIESPDNIEGSKESSFRSSSSTSSFDRELNELDDPAWKFALAPPTTTTTTTTTTISRRRKRSRNDNKLVVTFNPQVQLEYLPNRYDWPVEEKAARWISANEYIIFQLDISNTVFLLRNDPESIDDDSYSSRGVECKDPEATRPRAIVRAKRYQLGHSLPAIQTENTGKLQEPDAKQ
ncbi:hypothetical protein FRACYDRAFT_237932 [Fragilariopsis cylindrus CCMP1102]|uniref:Uncharacterized protein n=1 Tax=Fragilariopsis cylindrus CCMP1102 TaxID=635003 RepID=A0A1E7FHA7_9STRA|nr:hypothetical protein FRACYDRAFT_237932 [Fragilariopsis cylindrus CCMP1102]|eukprot:OEU17514.1 hypothetical protein FRACYDRAFT_237932 [Fragilariopsis cylindrus CCMP1102]